MEDLKAFVDGELSPERRSEVEAAMEQDERLRQELEEIRVLSRLIGDCVVEPEPVGLEETLHVLEARKPRPLFARIAANPMRYAWVGVLATFIAIVVFFPIFAQSKDAAKKMMASHVPASADATAKTAAPPIEERFRATKGGASEYEQKSGGLTTGGTTGMTTGGNTGGGGELSNGVDVTRDQAGAAPLPSPSGGRAGYGSAPADMPATTNPSLPGIDEQAKAQRSVKAKAPLLVRTADLTIVVTNVPQAQASASALTTSFGGYVESSNTTQVSGVPQAQLTLRVPEARFGDAMARLRKMGKVEAETTNSQDVTAQVADDEARLKTMRAEEESLVKLLKVPHKVSDTLEIRDKLNEVRQEIESLDAERKTLRNQATYSTITLSLTQAEEPTKPEPKPRWLDKAWEGASDRATGLGRWLAEVGMNLLVLAPIWLPIVVGVWWLGRRGRRVR